MWQNIQPAVLSRSSLSPCKPSISIIYQFGYLPDASSELCEIVFCQFIESDHTEISGVVEEPYHPVDGGEGDDVEQNHHIACNSFLYQQQKYVTEFIMGELNIGEYREMRKTYCFNEFQDKLREIVFSGCPILKKPSASPPPSG